MNGEGIIDERFNIISMMQEFGWTYQEYLQRPKWIDEFYRIKNKAEAKAQEVKADKAKQQNG